MSVGFDSQAVVFERFAPYLGASDLFQCAPVSKFWKKFSEQPFLWRELCEKTGIPLVESRQNYDYKKHFRSLYSITIRGEMIDQCLGEMVGKVPIINSLVIKMLEEEDPFEAGVKIRDNYYLVVLPALVKRTNERNLALDQKGCLFLDKARKPKDLTVQLSLHNLKMLCDYPALPQKGKKVFAVKNLNSIFTSSCSFVDEPRAYLMRKSIVSGSVEKSWRRQKDFVQKFGYEVTPLIVRVFSLCVLKNYFGTFPDEKGQWSFARMAEMICFGDKVCHLAVGGSLFQPGVHVILDDNVAYGDTGVVPCCRMGRWTYIPCGLRSCCDLSWRIGFHRRVEKRNI